MCFTGVATVPYTAVNLVFEGNEMKFNFKLNDFSNLENVSSVHLLCTGANTDHSTCVTFEHTGNYELTA